MSLISMMDEYVKEYLLFRRFTNTVKAFEAEVKNDRDKRQNCNKIVDQLLAYLYSYDLKNLMDYWKYLDQQYLSHLEKKYMQSVRKLEISLLRLYLVNAVQNNKGDKVVEFFERNAQLLQKQSDWRDWTSLPYLKNPEENATFAVYFTKQWQETFIMSMFNFFNIVLQCKAPVPTLLRLIGTTKIQDLETGLQNVPAGADASPSDLQDDFYVISPKQEPSEQGLISKIKSMAPSIRKSVSDNSTTSTQE